MFTGICLYAENHNDVLDPVVAELVTAALGIKEMTGEPVQALLISEKCANLTGQLERLGVDEVYAVETKKTCRFMDDAISQVVAEALARISPSAVLIPANPEARSLFSRTAILMGTGLTADCTELRVVSGGDGTEHCIKQNKPSFGDNIMVSIITKKSAYPQMMTIRQGVYPPHEASGAAKVRIERLDIEIPESKIEVLEITPYESRGDSISSAQVVCVGGRGSITEDNLSLLKEFSDKIGGVLAGTRPLADEGIIPFENQIGQTGKTIRPQICVSFGVSGAIQHTEGIKDTKLFIAVNTDESAAIFNIADYGAAADMKDILASALELLRADSAGGFNRVTEG